MYLILLALSFEYFYISCTIILYYYIMYVDVDNDFVVLGFDPIDFLGEFEILLQQ